MATRNSSATSGANAAQTVTIAAISGQRVRLYSLDGFTNAGNSQITVKDGTTVIWLSSTTFLSSTQTSRTWTTPLEATPGNLMSVATSAAGGGNTATINIQADQVENK